MVKQKKRILLLLESRVMKLVENGNRCPTVSQILRPLNGRMPKTRRKTVLLIRYLRRALCKKYELHSCGISEDFYQPVRGPKGGIVRKSYKDLPPKSEEESKKCLPGGSGRKMEGLYFPKSPDEDPIYEEHLARYCNQAAKHLRGVLDKAEDGVKQGILSSRSTFGKLGETFAEYLGDRLMPALEGAIERAVKRLENKR